MTIYDDLQNCFRADQNQVCREDDFIAKGHQLKEFFQGCDVNRISLIIPENLAEEVKKIEQILQEELNPNLTNEQIAKHISLYNRFETKNEKTTLLPLGFFACMSSKNLINKFGPISGNRIPEKAKKIADVAINQTFKSFFAEYMEKKFGGLLDEPAPRFEEAFPAYPNLEKFDNHPVDIDVEGLFNDIVIEDENTEVPTKPVIEEVLTHKTELPSKPVIEEVSTRKTEVHSKPVIEEVPTRKTKVRSKPVIEDLPTRKTEVHSKPVIEDLPPEAPVEKKKSNTATHTAAGNPEVKKQSEKSTKEKETKKRNAFWKTVVSFFQGIFQAIAKLFSRGKKKQQS